MELRLDEDGHPISELSLALSGRKLSEARHPNEPHLNQAFSIRSRRFADAVSKFTTCLQDAELPGPGVSDSGSKPLVQSFRTLLYDSAELFDFYTQLLPKRLLSGRASKAIASDFSSATKRLRAPWAMMCNRLKHDTSDIAYTCGYSVNTLVATHGFMFVRAAAGDSMVIDEQVHPKPERRAAFIKTLHQLLHHVLRSDLNAAKAIRRLADDPEGSDFSAKTLEFKIGNELRWLSKQPVFAFNESPMFDAIELQRDRLILKRRMALLLPGPARIFTSHHADGQTRSFPFA